MNQDQRKAASIVAALVLAVIMFAVVGSAVQSSKCDWRAHGMCQGNDNQSAAAYRVCYDTHYKTCRRGGR